MRFAACARMSGPLSGRRAEVRKYRPESMLHWPSPGKALWSGFRGPAAIRLGATGD